MSKAVRGIASVLALGWALSTDTLWGQERPYRSPADVLVATGSLSDPDTRAKAVAAMAELQAERKALGVARAMALNLPVRQIMPDGRLIEVVDLDEEGHPLFYETHNANAAISTGANLLNAAPYALNGSGVVIGMWDGGGGRTSHVEFAGGRMTVKDGSSANDHSTHVGGTMIAAGVQASAKGMASSARVDSYDWNSDTTEMTSRGASASNQTGVIYLSNHSYGYISGWNYVAGGTPYRVWDWYGDTNAIHTATIESDFGRYSTYTRDIDALAFSAPYYLIFWSSGNDRNDDPVNGDAVALSSGGTNVVSYDSALHPSGDGGYRNGFENISFKALAKNILTVGAVNDAVSGGVRSPANGTMSTFSSWGPTDDGRIKPDVVANGVSLYSSTVGSDSSYGSKSGTSMAAPNATGTGALLIEEHRNLFGYAPRASMLKGLLIHTATDLGNAGPDYSYGWGLLHATSAVQVMRSHASTPGKQRMTEAKITSANRPLQYTMAWDGTSPIRATLCWTDPAGDATSTSDLRTPRLKNNLDLRIVSTNGQVFLPYVMPFVGTWSVASMSNAATTGTNNVDNVEQVYLAAPPVAGLYTVEVNYQGSLTGGEQVFSLLLDGAADAGAADAHLVITNPTADSVVGHAVTSVTVNGTAGSLLTGHFRWTNQAAGAGGVIAAATNWSIGGVVLAYGTNTVSISASNQIVAGFGANDNAAQPAYGDGWTTGDNGGLGFASWVLAPSGNSGTFVANTGANPGLSLASPAWGLWANSGGYVEAVRPLVQGLGVNGELRVSLDNQWISSGSSIGWALLNAANEYVMEFLFVGGGSTYLINDASTGRDTGLGYTTDGVNLVFTLTSTSTYRLVSGSVTNTGTLANRADLVPVTLKFWNNNAGSGEDYNFYFNTFYATNPASVGTTTATVRVTRENPPPPEAPVFASNATVSAVMLITTSFTVSVTGEPDPVLAFVATTANGTNSFVPATGVLTYTPSYEDGGGQTFTFSASNSAGVATQVVAVSVSDPRTAQTIAFASIADQLVTQQLGLAATASSGLPVTFSVSGPATLGGGTNLSFTATGVVSVVAAQAGDATYAPAPDVTNTFNVLPLPPPQMELDPPGPLQAVLAEGGSTGLSVQVVNSGDGLLNWTVDVTAYDADYDMEDGAPGWLPYGMNATWHVSTNRAFSGANAWYCGPTNQSVYLASMEAYLEMPYVLLHTNNPVLRFRQYIDVEEDTATVAWDGGLVMITGTNGLSEIAGQPTNYTHRWIYNTNVPMFSGSAGWHDAEIDLSSHAGQPVKLTFLFVTDEAVEYEGWYIDDVAVSPRDAWGDWLSIAPLTGTVAPGTASNIALTVSAGAYPNGASRFAKLVFAGNDPVTPTIELDVVMAVEKLPATVALTNLVQLYDGTTRTATALTSPTGLPTVLTYEGELAGPVEVGAYAVTASVRDFTYEGTTTGTLSIVNLNGAIAVSDAIGDTNDLNVPFGWRTLGETVEATVTVHNTNTLFDLTLHDVRMTGSGETPGGTSLVEPKVELLAVTTTEKKPSKRDQRKAALASEAPRAPDSLIVRFKDDAVSTPAHREAAHAALGATTLRRYQRLPADVVKLPPGADLNVMIEAYEAHPDVAYAEPNFTVTLAGVPDDPHFTNQWALLNTGQSGGTVGADISAVEAWAITTGSSNVIVAIIDTGIDYNHPDLAANMWINPNPTFGDVYGARFISGDGVATSGDPMDDQGHGTHVAGTVGAISSNGVGVAGVAWNVRLMALKFITSANQGSLADAIACIEYAVEHGARISNNSWGGGGFSQTMEEVLIMAERAGHLFVAAAGNAGTNNDSVPFYPASYTQANVLAVANSSRTDARWSTSCYGANSVDLAAPGTTIRSTMRNNSYGDMTGTSMAAPHVSGVAALLMARHPDTPYADLKRWIMEGVDVLPSWSGLVVTGGRLNAEQTLLEAQLGVSNTNGWPVVIPPGGSAQLTVRYHVMQAGDALDTLLIGNNDSAHPSVEVTISGRGRVTQAIAFTLTPTWWNITNSAGLAATASSGLPVAFSISNGPGEVDGTNLTFIGAGEVVIAANQAGDSNWVAAAEVTATVQAYADTNANRAPDDWEAAHFDPGYTVTATSDADGDGASDVDEFIAGTSPTNASHRLEILPVAVPQEGAPHLVLQWTSISNRFYRVGRMTNLFDSTTWLTSGLPATPPLNTYTSDLPGSAGSLYHRIGVTLDP